MECQKTKSLLVKSLVEHLLTGRLVASAFSYYSIARILFRNARRHHREGSTSIIPSSQWHYTLSQISGNPFNVTVCLPAMPGFNYDYFGPDSSVSARRCLLSHTLGRRVWTLLGYWALSFFLLHCRAYAHKDSGTDGIPDPMGWIPLSSVSVSGETLGSYKFFQATHLQSSDPPPPADTLGDWSSNVLYPYAPRHRRQMLWGEHTPPIRGCSTNILT